MNRPPGNLLKNNNEQIVSCLVELREQRKELDLLIAKQQEERLMLLEEYERIKYKISLISKSLSQRLVTRDKYDQRIKEVEEYYQNLVQHSSTLLGVVQKDVDVLEGAIDKKIGTDLSKPAFFTSHRYERDIPPSQTHTEGIKMNKQVLSRREYAHVTRTVMQQASTSRKKEMQECFQVYDSSSTKAQGHITTIINPDESANLDSSTSGKELVSIRSDTSLRNETSSTQLLTGLIKHDSII